MNPAKPFIILLFAICASWQIVTAQEKATADIPLANKDVIEMVRSGLSAELVLAKIKRSTCGFDTSPSALITLMEAGVPNDIMIEMVRNPHGQIPKVEAPPPIASPTPVQTQPREPPLLGDNLPEYGDISEIRRMRRVFVIADDIDSQNLLINALSNYDGLQVVNSPERAQLFVGFSQGSLATSMQFRGLFAGHVDYRTKAQFIVFYRAESGRNRIVWRETEDIQTSSGMTFSRPNEVNVIRHFIKELEKLRSE
jgi:hypothetical protein